MGVPQEEGVQVEVLQATELLPMEFKLEGPSRRGPSNECGRSLSEARRFSHLAHARNYIYKSIDGIACSL